MRSHCPTRSVRTNSSFRAASATRCCRMTADTADLLLKKCRHGDVPRQGTRTQQHPAVCAGTQREGCPATVAGGRFATCAGQWRILPLLPAADGSGHAPHCRHGDADPLAASATRADFAGSVHSAGRGNRADRADRGLGPAHRLRPGQSLAGCGTAAGQAVGQSLRPPVHPARSDRIDQADAGRNRAVSRVSRTGTDGKPHHAQCRVCSSRPCAS